MIDVAELYAATPYSELTKLLLVEYRCFKPGKHCVLLHVWNSPHGRLWCLPSYKLAPATAFEQTAESARAKRTEDGLRKWRPRGGSFDELLDDYGFDLSGNSLSMNCDHLRNVAVPLDLIAAHAAAAKPGKPERQRVSLTGLVGK